jgi:hypothetical protein
MVFLSGTIEAKSVLGSAKNLVKKIEQKICPVMGGKINPNLYYEYNKNIYVCCKDCIAIIKKNPEKYLKKMQKDIDAAKKKALAKKKILKLK